jgi:hypothetical protein
VYPLSAVILNLLLKLLFEDPDIYVGNMGRAFEAKNQSEDRKLNSKNFNKKATSWGFREPLLEKV